MSASVVTKVTRACALALGLAMVAVPLSAGAQSERNPHGKSEGKAKAAPIDQRVGQKLNKAIEALNADKNNDARDILEGLVKSSLSPYERARVENLLAMVSQNERKYGEARQHLQKAIDSEGLNDQEMSTDRFQIAQLFLAEEKWKEGAQALEAWFASGATPNSNAYYLLAIAYYQMQKYDRALEPAEKAIALSERPQESWLQLLLALRVEREEYDKALPIVRRLVEIQPTNRNYWMQLSSINSMLERYNDALVSMQVAYNAGWFKDESEYMRLADLLLHSNIPFRAALILGKAIDAKLVTGDAKSWEKLGNCWIAARQPDKAIPPLGKAAAASDDGSLFVRLAEVYVEREQWDKAVDAINKANAKGDLKNPADAQLLMGVALFNQKKFREARGYFLRAAQDEKKKNEAQGWLRYLDAEAAQQQGG